VRYTRHRDVICQTRTLAALGAVGTESPTEYETFIEASWFLGAMAPRCGGLAGVCGRYRMTVPRLRQLYNDTAHKLCGDFDDLAGGTRDLSKANLAETGRECPEGEICRANVCQK
jgi:hypothetical protein